MIEPRAPSVLLFGFRRPLNQAAVRQALDRTRVRHVGLVSRSNFLGSRADYFLTTRRGFRDCTFHANPFRAFPPASFIQAQQDSEGMVLRMYERIYRRLSAGQSFEVRKRMYLEQLAWAYGMLVDGDYDTVIFSDVPHNPFGLILHNVARALGRQVFFFLQIQFKDSYVIASSVDGAFAPIRAEYQRLRAAGGEVMLGQRAQHEFDRRTGKEQPFYMSRSGLSPARRLRDWAKWTFRIDTRLRVHRTARNGIAYLRARREMPPAGTPFVYFPLHLQPEAQTAPLGGVFVDQYLAVELLSRALPPGWLLLVKEHPAQRLAKRDYGFYEHLGRLRNVRLVSRKVSTFRLAEEGRAVASITGTAGWEALFAGKPVLVLGNAFYRGAPGTICVDDPTALARELAEIAADGGPRRTIDDLRRFLVAVENCTREGIVDQVYLRDSALAEEESISRYAYALSSLIQAPSTGNELPC